MKLCTYLRCTFCTSKYLCWVNQKSYREKNPFIIYFYNEFNYNMNGKLKR